MPRLINPVPSRIHDAGDLSDETLTDRGDALIAVTGLPETAIPAVKATGSINFSAVPTAGDTVTVNGVTYTFIAGASAGTDINIKGSAALQATELAAVLNASVNANISVATYTANGAVVNVEYDTAGTGGNAFTLAENSSAIVVSGPYLIGGTAATSRYANVIRNFMHG